MAEFGELKVSVTLSLNELRDIVSLLNFAQEGLLQLGLDVPAVSGELSEMYFQTMEQLEGTDFADFSSE